MSEVVGEIEAAQPREAWAATGGRVAHAKIVMSQNPEQPEWLNYRDAAELMHRPAAYFRARHVDGQYKYWPEIERWQPGGRGTRLYIRREHVERWIEASRTPAPCPVRQEFSGIGYESIVPELRRMGLGGERLIRSLGLAYGQGQREINEF